MQASERAAARHKKNTRRAQCRTFGARGSGLCPRSAWREPASSTWWHRDAELEVLRTLHRVPDDHDVALPQRLPSDAPPVNEGAIERLAVLQDDSVVRADDYRVPPRDHVGHLGAVQGEVARLWIPADHKVALPGHVQHVARVPDQVDQATARVTRHLQPLLGPRADVEPGGAPANARGYDLSLCVLSLCLRQLRSQLPEVLRHGLRSLQHPRPWTWSRGASRGAPQAHGLHGAVDVDNAPDLARPALLRGGGAEAGRAGLLGAVDEDGQLHARPVYEEADPVSDGQLLQRAPLLGGYLGDLLAVHEDLGQVIAQDV
mmetsp:Transcript_85432/g.226884  ORF Transcript_85432/g.226884 Transcript_85432/m.226884 type:complete len:317 (-) Transcript_85432:570-1520(-)